MAPRLIASREACMKTRLSLIIAIVAMFSLPAQASAALAIGSQAPDFTTNGALAGQVFKLHLAEQLKNGDRKSVVSGKSVSVRVDLGGGAIIKNNKKTKKKRQ